LGYSQTDVLPVMQTASLFSVHGVSALIVLVAVACTWIVRDGLRAAWRPAVVIAAVVAAFTGWGAWRMSHDTLTRSGTPLRVGIVQGNIPQDRKWDPTYRDTILGRYLRLTREVAAEGATLVLWPESSTPFFFGRDQTGTEAVRAVAHDTGIHLVVGSDDARSEERRVGKEGGTSRATAQSVNTDHE